MAITQAESLDDATLKKFLANVVSTSPRPLVDRAAFLLSYKAGLRVQEIAGLQWDIHILGHEGKFRTEEFLVPGSKGRVKRAEYPVLKVTADIGKYGSARTIRVHDDLLEALRELYESRGDDGGWVIPSGHAKANQGLKSRAHALAVRINRVYAKLNLPKCTSHSGRRTFITNAARKAVLTGCSLRDVQVLAGHKDLSTTQAYIDITQAQADLVGLL